MSLIFRITEMKAELAQQIRADFEVAFQGPTSKVSTIAVRTRLLNYSIKFNVKYSEYSAAVLLCGKHCVQYGPINQTQLKEACFVVNVLEPRVKKDLLAWFIKLQLAEYQVLFADNQDVSTNCELYVLQMRILHEC
jgi:hypothetical protein